MLRAAVLLGACLLVGAFRGRSDGGGQLGAAVAGIVAVHPPKFRFLLDFFKHWETCDAARDALDFYVVFSDESNSTAFIDAWSRSGGNGTRVPWKALIAQDLSGKNPASWKKLDGLAQILDMSPERRYEFGLIMDAEIALNSCAGFAGLLGRLREKQAAGTWYGDRANRHGPSKARYAACAVSPRPPPGREPKRASCGDPEVAARLSQQTSGFNVYTWWTDVPYVHMGTARRMFESWAVTLGKSRIGRTTMVEAARSHLSSLPTPSEVSASMGGGQNKSESLRNAGSAFEHLIYQLYTVAYEGFAVKDLTDKITGKGGIGEYFCGLGEEDKQVALKTIRPLWLPAGCPCQTTPSGPPLLLFHVDRNRERNLYCDPETARRLGY